MSTDNDLLELAAIAAGYETDWVLCADDTHILHVWDGDICMEWNPLTDDGDALRLAVKLEMRITQGSHYLAAAGYLSGIAPDSCKEKVGTDRIAATRRAIVRTAAEIGRIM